MKAIFLGLGFVMATGFVACSTAQKAQTTATVQKIQEVEFTEAEVPYIQTEKIDGKMSAKIVDTTKSVSAAN